jgi:hypothetical protein
VLGGGSEAVACAEATKPSADSKVCWAHSSCDGEQARIAKRCRVLELAFDGVDRTLMREEMTGCNVPRDLVI